MIWNKNIVKQCICRIHLLFSQRLIWRAWKWMKIKIPIDPFAPLWERPQLLDDTSHPASPRLWQVLKFKSKHEEGLGFRGRENNGYSREAAGRPLCPFWNNVQIKCDWWSERRLLRLWDRVLRLISQVCALITLAARHCFMVAVCFKRLRWNCPRSTSLEKIVTFVDTTRLCKN